MRQRRNEIVEALQQSFRVTFPPPLKPEDRIIDCDTPKNPEKWRIIEHRVHGKITWDPDQALLWGNEQFGSETPNGYASDHIYTDELDSEVSKLPVYNSNVLFHLLRFQQLIPECCFETTTIFRGTVYLDKEGDRSVLCLRYFANNWQYRPQKIGKNFFGHTAAWIYAPDAK